MGIEIDENTIKEIEDIIIPSFVGNYSSKVTDIGSIAVCLQAILNEVDRLKEELSEKIGSELSGL